MSDTFTHAYTWLRWRSSIKSKSWARSRVRRAQFAREVEEGLREFEDTCGIRRDGSLVLNYTRRPYLHVWYAAEDQRKMGWHPLNRLRDRHIERLQKRYTDRILKRFMNALDKCPACWDYKETIHTCGQYT